MLIKKMILENFRQYNGIQEVVFSTDKEKNVTLFLGENGAGKTVISQAFVWCLYGITPMFVKKDLLLSKKVEETLYENSHKTVSVIIYMEHAHKEYVIKRSMGFTIKNDKLTNSNAVLSITRTENGVDKELLGKELANCINEILPQELSEYFFLSGEKIDSMSIDIKSGRSKDFANAVNTLLDLDYYKNAIKHLKIISNEYDVTPVTGMESDLENIISNITSNENNLKRFKEKKSNLEESQDIFNEEIIDCQAKLRSMTSSSEIQYEIEAEEKRLRSADAAITSNIEWGIKDFVQKIPYYVIQDSIKDMNDTLSEVMNLQTEDIPERLHAELIDWIEKRGECICGNKIKHDDACYEILEKWRHIVPPESIGILAKQMKAKTQDKIRLGTGLNEKLTDYKHQIYQKADDKDAFNDKIDRLREELAKADDTSEIQSKLKMARNNADLTRTDLNQCIELIAKIESELIKYKKEYEVAISDNKEGKKILKWKSITEKLLDNFQTQIEKDEQEKRELLIKYVKEAFERIYGSSFSIEIDSNYRITTNTPVEKSTGQGMSVIFAFLAGLLQVIKTDKGRKDDNKSIELESYPLVLDAPFSALDKKRIAAICDVLPIVSEQIIIFIKDTDGELAKKEMSGKIGKSYRLTKIDNSDMETEIIPEEI